MPDPFRQLATTPTAAALAKLDAMPVHPLRAACAAVVEYRVVPNADANRHWVKVAHDEKLTLLGCAAEGLLSASQKRIFVDEAKTTQAHISSSRYFFVTYFESGRCMLTFHHSDPATISNENLAVRAGTSDFFFDYESHCQAVEEWIDQGETPIAVLDIETAVALGRFYYRHVLGLGQSARLVFFSAPAFLIYFMLLLLLRRFL